MVEDVFTSLDQGGEIIDRVFDNNGGLLGAKAEVDLKWNAQMRVFFCFFFFWWI